MKILISGLFDHELWKHPFFEHISSALEKEGHEVIRYPANSDAVRSEQKQWHRWLENLLTIPFQLAGMKKRNACARIRPHLPWAKEFRKRTTQREPLVQAVRQYRPDVVIVISYVCYSEATLRSVREEKFRFGKRAMLIGWCVEGPWVPWTPEEECVKYDRYFCIHDHFREEFRHRIEVLPAYALNKMDFHPLANREVKKRKIVFVGGGCERRREFLRAIHDLPLEIWGPRGWHEDPLLAKCFRGKSIWGESLNALYNEAEIVLDILSWNPALSGVTQRVVDVPASGAFLLTDASKDLSKLYRVGEEVEAFGSPEELRSKCLFYLENPQRRNEIARRGHEAAMKFPDFSETARRLITPCRR